MATAIRSMTFWAWPDGLAADAVAEGNLIWRKNNKQGGDAMIRKIAAEFFGTFWLVFGGCGSAVLAAAFPDVGIGLLGVALAFGLTVLTMAYAVGHVSGGHFNPAVSVCAARLSASVAFLVNTMSSARPPMKRAMVSRAPS